MNARDERDAPDLARRWARLSGARRKWAFEAYNRFVASLGEEMRSHFATGEEGSEAYVVVFGRTQVGKTTLLLDLMGVAPQFAAGVSSVLRGGREIGKSATATAMEYRRSPDERWRLNWDAEQVFVEDHAMEVALAALRQRMSSGRLVADKPVVVSIPAGRFDVGTGAAPRVRILDLPGDNPREGVEQAHVTAMAEKYVPNADLILLVGRADDLSFLNLDALTLPRIQDWRIIPQRFRIVTTYSFTPDSQRKQVDARDGPLTADGFRRRLRQQIETFGRPLPEDEVPSNLLFPLEFGDSWTSQAARQDGFYERINPIVAELKQQLHRDIEESATEIGRIRSAVQVHVIADNVKKARLVQLDAALSCERERLEALEDEQARVARRLEMAEKALAGLAHLSKLEAEVPAGIERDCQTLAESAKACGAKLRGEIETNRNSFIDKISTYSSALLSVSMDYRPELIFGDKDNFWTNISPAEEPNRDELRDVIQREFETTRKKLSGYFLEEYYPNVSRDFAIDKALLDWDMTAAANAARKWLAAHWKTRAAERLERKKKEQKLAKSRATLARGDLDEVTRRCAAQQDLLAGKEQERQAFSDRMDRERETGGDFRAYLDEAYLLALRARMREGREAAAPSESLLMLLSAAQLGEERKNILIGQ